MRIRSILTAVTLTAAILIGGTGTAAAQSQPLPNGRCLLEGLVNNINVPIIGVLVPDTSVPDAEAADPCDALLDIGNL